LRASSLHESYDVVYYKTECGLVASKFNIMVSASGFILAVSQHTMEMD